MRPFVILALTIFQVSTCSTFYGAEERPSFLVLMADNWAWPHAGCLGDPVVRTPAIDAVAKRGTSFDHAFCLSPSCSPARAAFLTGQTIHRLAEAASLHGLFPSRYQVFPDRLQQAGYHVGHSGKGWAPGKWKKSGRTRNPSGKNFKNFESFIASDESDRPFFFWFSSRYPHIPWESGEDRKADLDANAVKVPAYLPDSGVVRDNILDYYAEVELFDQQCAAHLKLLEESGKADETIVIICGDNGWQMPHGLAHIYDAGTRVPLIFAGAEMVQHHRVCSELVNFDDLAPTILELAGAKPLPDATGVSLAPLLTGNGVWRERESIFLSRERHANVRKDNASYPVRAIRTKTFLYVRNFASDRWPAGDPKTWFAVGPYGDVDYTYTKRFILQRQHQEEMKPFYAMNFGKRPAEELYDVRVDPDQTRNVCLDEAYLKDRKRLNDQLAKWMRETNDPRFTDPETDFWDKAPYFGGRATPTEQTPKRDLVKP